MREILLTSFDKKEVSHSLSVSFSKRKINGKKKKRNRRKKENDYKCQYVFFQTLCQTKPSNFICSFFGNATQLFHLFPFHCVYTYLKDLSSIITIITISYRQKSLSIPIVLFLLLFFQMLSATKQVVNTFIYFWVAPLKLVLDGGWLKKKRRKKERKFSLSLLI